MARETQVQKILKYLQQYGSITPHEALFNFSCMRLADVVFKLKKPQYGEHKIETIMVKGKNKFDEEIVYAQYKLIKPEPEVVIPIIVEPKKETNVCTNKEAEIRVGTQISLGL